MNDQVEIFILASADVRRTLTDNETDLGELLREKRVDVRSALSNDPGSALGSGAKEVTEVLLASAAVVLSLTPIIRAAIEAISNRKIVVREMVLIPVEDSMGRHVLDRNGNPVLQWMERARVVGSTKPTASSTKMQLKGPFGFQLIYQDKLGE